MPTPRRPPIEVAEDIEHRRRYRKHIGRVRLMRSLGYAGVGAVIAFSIILAIARIW